jgi:hypothetical protein
MGVFEHCITEDHRGRVVEEFVNIFDGLFCANDSRFLIRLFLADGIEESIENFLERNLYDEAHYCKNTSEPKITHLRPPVPLWLIFLETLNHIVGEVGKGTKNTDHHEDNDEENLLNIVSLMSKGSLLQLLFLSDAFCSHFMIIIKL